MTLSLSVKSSLNLGLNSSPSLDHSMLQSLLLSYKLHPIVQDVLLQSSSTSDFIVEYLKVANPIIDTYIYKCELNLITINNFTIMGNRFEIEYNNFYHLRLNQFISIKNTANEFGKGHPLLALHLYHLAYDNITSQRKTRDALYRLRAIDK